MKYFYEINTANYPRHFTDNFFADYHNEFSYTGIVHDTISFIENSQLLKPELWKRFVNQFRLHSDNDQGWRGEYWGKMMRGACFIYSYTKNPELYNILCDTVKDIISTAEENGRISTYTKDAEFDSWDLWCRKYVLLGMQYFLEICADTQLNERIVTCMCRQANYIIEHIGDESGKKSITSAARFWRGLASSSILEPFVRLYNITNDKKYLDFSAYIVKNGGIDVANIFELAYENKLYPYQYPVTKAYEMISCFEGLLEYYRTTKDEKYKISVINFADKLLESDFTIVGSAGCSHELFDHSTVRQANTTNGLLGQETCVTVTLMKFMYQMTLLTGNPKYADAFEISYYNAYLGTVNTENKLSGSHNFENYCIKEPLPFDSYSPLIAGKRGNGIGGMCIMPDNHYYGCCACIGAAGAGLVPKLSVLSDIDGIAVNLYINGTVKTTTPNGNTLKLNTTTNYPCDGKIKLTLHLKCAESFAVKLRNPHWSENTSVSVNTIPQTASKGYMCLYRLWKDGDTIELVTDMRTKAIRPTPYGNQLINTRVPERVMNYMTFIYDEEDPKAKNHIAFRRGPIILAQDSRLGYDINVPITPVVNANDCVDATVIDGAVSFPHIVGISVPLENSESLILTDYASAGKLWCDESMMAAWILTKASDAE